MEVWMAASSDCVGTGAFEYRRAFLHYALGDSYLAEELLRGIVEDDLPYFQHEAEIAVAMIHFNRAIQQPVVVDAEVQKIHDVLVDFYRANPTSTPAIEQIIIQKLFLGEYDKVYKFAKLALKLDPLSWAAHRGLAISGARHGRSSDAGSHIRPAIETRNERFGDREFIFAAAFCYLDTGSSDVAEQALRRLYVADPSVAQDPRYVNIAKAILSANSPEE